MADAADRDVERAGDGRGREARERGLALVRHDADPVVRARDRALDSAIFIARFSLIVTAWLWQRIAPMRTQMPSIGTGAVARPRILLPSAPALNSSRL